MTTKTDEWRHLALNIGLHDITLIQDRFLEACDEIEQLEAHLSVRGKDGTENIRSLLAHIDQLEARLALAEKVCQSAEWVIQDPTLSHTDCSSEPWEQSHDSRDRLADDVKSWRTAKEAKP